MHATEDDDHFRSISKTIIIPPLLKHVSSQWKNNKRYYYHGYLRNSNRTFKKNKSSQLCQTCTMGSLVEVYASCWSSSYGEDSDSVRLDLECASSGKGEGVSGQGNFIAQLYKQGSIFGIGRMRLIAPARGKDQRIRLKAIRRLLWLNIMWQIPENISEGRESRRSAVWRKSRYWGCFEMLCSAMFCFSRQDLRQIKAVSHHHE